MKNQKYLNRLKRLGWQVKNIDGNGNVRFLNTHTCGNQGYEPDFFWVENNNLKRLADELKHDGMTPSLAEIAIDRLKILADREKEMRQN